MLNKLQFNNLVITNKKVIQQARAQTIAKLVQKLRKLKASLEKQPENEKHKDRLRKNVECMAQLKTLKRVEIMRSLLLLDDKKLNAVLTNGRATPDEIAIAMLGLNKKMQALVAKFRETLELTDDTTAKWREEILETSKRRLKLDRTEERRRKRKELKEQKALTRNRLEWLEEHKPAADCITDEAEAGTAKAVETPEQVNKLEINKDELKMSSKPDKLEKQQKANERLKKPKTEPKQRTNIQKPKVIAAQQPKESKRVGPENKEFPTQRQTNEKPKEDKQWKELNKKTKTIKKEKKERPTHVVDPFFITESGQPYLSTAVVLSDDSHNESDEDDYQVEQRYRKPIAKRQKYNDTRPNNDRHPSWVAKQQQKPVITNFKGTKTKFSEDGSASATTSAPAPASLTVATAGDDSTAGMHPSWIAKQRLKPKIATFVGTKIKFDDE